jgi:prolyl oligopeptidase
MRRAPTAHAFHITWWHALALICRSLIKYPALLLDSGSNDVRCPPWHVRKMAARMQSANAGPNPILMRVRVRDGAGHGTVGFEEHQLQESDVLTFFADQLGLDL